jgi:hypothetical protein
MKYFLACYSMGLKYYVPSVVEHGGDVVLLEKGKFVSTLCDRMQGALNSVESW